MQNLKMNALTFSEFGTAEVLEYKTLPTPTIDTGEVLVKMKAIGLNYADIYRRKGNYHLKGNSPYIAGYEGAGEVIATKSSKYEIGDRVAFTDVPYANAEYVNVPESQVIALPDAITYDVAASVLLQGLTAHYLSEDSHNVKKAEIVLIHAASGGVGQILTQICKMKEAIVIGMSRSEAKLKVISRHNANHSVLLDDKWTNKVLDITKGVGVDVVYDSVGVTLQKSFEVTREKGHVVFYGMSGGDPAPVDPRMLMDTSKTLSGGDLWSYITTHEERNKRASILFDWILNDKLKLEEPVRFKLSEGKAAHEFFEAGKSSGKILLIPDSEF
ncbi:quinone oxidoreductase family protein [Gillisia marina]|uniref:quinone oxidoreductase family protein n=1 Tax=Gillisia marina TaxID=1167637 RepID=UPI0002FE7040|nr:quinone oxidoreductase [Gillisia marina]